MTPSPDPAGEADPLRAAAEEVLRLEIAGRKWARRGPAYFSKAETARLDFDVCCRNAAPLLARAVIAQRQEGWIVVTEDEATWPPDSDAQVLAETDGMNDGHGTPRDCFRREMRAEVARMLCEKHTTSRPHRWMPWPTAPVAARPEPVPPPAAERAECPTCKALEGLCVECGSVLVECGTLTDHRFAVAFGSGDDAFCGGDTLADAVAAALKAAAEGG